MLLSSDQPLSQTYLSLFKAHALTFVLEEGLNLRHAYLRDHISLHFLHLNLLFLVLHLMHMGMQHLVYTYMSEVQWNLPIAIESILRATKKRPVYTVSIIDRLYTCCAGAMIMTEWLQGTRVKPAYCDH